MLLYLRLIRFTGAQPFGPFFPNIFDKYNKVGAPGPGFREERSSPAASREVDPDVRSAERYRADSVWERKGSGVGKERGCLVVVDGVTERRLHYTLPCRDLDHINYMQNPPKYEINQRRGMCIVVFVPGAHF